jgi:hypothetical protein
LAEDFWGEAPSSLENRMTESKKGFRSAFFHSEGEEVSHLSTSVGNRITNHSELIRILVSLDIRLMRCEGRID